MEGGYVFLLFHGFNNIHQAGMIGDTAADYSYIFDIWMKPLYPIIVKWIHVTEKTEWAL